MLEKLKKRSTCRSTAERRRDGRNTRDGWLATVIAHLSQWQELEDCPLPDLYRHACQAAPRLTIGRFHDGLRTLHERQQIYLHPWTGPLYEIPQPALALLVGHEVAYYASLRTSKENL